MSKTNDNLKTAFAGESQANRKYLAFAEKAESEGKPNLAKLFYAAAEGETVHALNHLKTLGDVKSSEENLEAAISGETYEIEEMYPGFISDAEADADNKAKISFGGANKVEEIHQKLFKEALEKVKAGGDIEGKDYFICQTCGYPAMGEAPDNCPICGQPRDQFEAL